MTEDPRWDAALNEALAMSREVTDLLITRWPQPSTKLELALLIVAAGIAKDGDKPLDARKFAKLAAMTFVATMPGEVAPSGDR